MVAQSIRVLVATQTEQVYEILQERDDVRYDIALFTGTIRDLIPQVQLIIIDYDDIVEFPLKEVEIRELIFGSAVRECSSEDFCSAPEDYLSDVAVNRWGNILKLPEHVCIAFASYSGGVGRTALAMDTALYYVDAAKRFADKNKRAIRGGTPAPEPTAMLVELTYGVSSLCSLTGVDMPSLMRLATDPESDVHVHRGVSMIPMDYDNVRMLAVDLLERFFQREMAKNAVTVVDAIWPHGLSDALASFVDLWVVPASERPDTEVNAIRLKDELSAAYGEENVWLLKNCTETTEESPDEPQWHVRVPKVARPDEFRGEMGRIVISHVLAPLWDTVYDVPKKAGLFGGK